MEVKLPTTKELLKKRRAAAKAAKEAEIAAAAAKAAQGNVPEPFPILESSPEPPEKPQEPPAKKRKVVEKGKKKILANRSKKSKVATPEPSVATEASAPEVEQINVDLPSSTSFLQDKSASVDFMSRILSEVDDQILNDGPIRNHFDNLLWESLKVNFQICRFKFVY